MSDPNLGRFIISGTQVSLGPLTTGHDESLLAIDILMCVILGMDKLGEAMGGDPLEDGKVVYEFGEVEVTLEDRGTPRGRFTNDIGFSALRGLAQWMTQYNRYREITARVYYNYVYFCGVVKVEKISMSTAAANGTAVSTTPNAVASSVGAGDIAAA